MTLHIMPLRNMVLVRAQTQPPKTGIQVIAAVQAVGRFEVLACGPEVRDIQVGQIVVANRLAGTTIGGQLLLPESAILGTLNVA